MFSFEQSVLVPPEAVTLDTSFVVRGIITSERLHAACRSFLIALSASQSILVFNRLLEVELWEVALRIAIKERFPADWSRRRPDGRVLRRARRLFDEVMGAWREILDVIPYVRVELQEVDYLAPHLITHYGLSSFDAVHAATALHVGVPDFVTTDAGFRRVPQTYLSLWVDSSRVPICRGERRTRLSAPLPRP